MSKRIKLTRGADIKLAGVADKIKADAPASASYAIKPTDFHGLTPKLVVKEGDEVKAGDPLFYDKYNESILFTSPVSGEVAAIVRGAKRKILEVRVVADAETRFKNFEVGDAASQDSDRVKNLLLESGFWPYIVQRPYAVLADPTVVPKAIFISAFDSSPLAPDYDFILHGEEASFQRGINALKKLTTGKVHLGTRADGSTERVFTDAKGVQINQFSGPHPAGNVGVQIHHVDPINKGDKVWTINPQAVVMIGRFLETGKADFTKTIALAGSEVEKPKYYKTKVGASMKSIIQSSMKAGNNRIISGNVLTGTKTDMDGYLGFAHDVVTIIPEGNEPQFLGWLAPNLRKFSLSRAYFSWLMPNKRFELNTNMNGEDRAYVITGQYEKVLPMDIYPVHLIKSIMTEDVEKMEVLGIYEVAPEDMALCEFACTSKVDVQNWLRKGLDLAQKELG